MARLREPGTQSAAIPAVEVTESVPQPLDRYRVELNCPTPLSEKVMEVEAHNEAEAKAIYCRANGISDSIHSWKITRIR